MFERPITFSRGDGSSSAGHIDWYRLGHFLLEAEKPKVASTGTATKGFDDAKLRARAQPASEARGASAVLVGSGRRQHD